MVLYLHHSQLKFLVFVLGSFDLRFYGRAERVLDVVFGGRVALIVVLIVGGR